MRSLQSLRKWIRNKSKPKLVLSSYARRTLRARDSLSRQEGPSARNTPGANQTSVQQLYINTLLNPYYKELWSINPFSPLPKGRKCFCFLPSRESQLGIDFVAALYLNLTSRYDNSALISIHTKYSYEQWIEMTIHTYDIVMDPLPNYVRESNCAIEPKERASTLSSCMLNWPLCCAPKKEKIDPNHP